MSDFRCSCPSRTLLWHGCQCNNYRKPRTIPINISIPEVGFKAAWQLISESMGLLDYKKVAKLKEPSDIEGLMRIMWWIETEDPDLYDNIARSLEYTFCNKNKPISARDRQNTYNQWRFSDG